MPVISVSEVSVSPDEYRLADGTAASSLPLVQVAEESINSSLTLEEFDNLIYQEIAASGMKLDRYRYRYPEHLVSLSKGEPVKTQHNLFGAGALAAAGFTKLQSSGDDNSAPLEKPSHSRPTTRRGILIRGMALIGAVVGFASIGRTAGHVSAQSASCGSCTQQNYTYVYGPSWNQCDWWYGCYFGCKQTKTDLYRLNYYYPGSGIPVCSYCDTIVEGHWCL